MIKLYNNVTANDNGNTNGTEINGSNKIEFVLNSSESEEKIQAIAIRTDENYKTIGSTVIGLSGASKNYWALSIDNNNFSPYGEAITLSEEITATNRIFYIKAKSETNEEVKIDSNCEVTIQCTISAIN